MIPRQHPLRILILDPVYGRHTPFWFAPLGLGYIAAALKQKFRRECSIEILRDKEEILSSLESRQYDVVASSNYVWNTALSNKYLRLAKSLKPGSVTIQGGPHFQSAESEVAAEYLRSNSSVDYYIHGEGEGSMVSLVERLLGGASIDEAVPGLAYLRDGCYIDGGRRPRMRDLNSIPSPYLHGLLDRFIGQGYAPIIETNRGCPFSCTFCNWGSATLSKVHRFDLDRIFEELEYIADQVRNNDSLTVADANFGILSRDLEIAHKIESLWQKRGYPAHLLLWHTKNSSRKTIEIGKILGKKVRILLAVQSLNPRMLENIKRSNIKLEAYEDLAAYAHENGLWTASDLIIGLPGEDLASIKRSLEILYRRGIDKVDLFSLMLIPGTEMYAQAKRGEFGMRTMNRLADGCVTSVGGDTVAEVEEVVVETDTLPFNDYLTLIMYSAVTIFWHHCGIGQPVANYARRHGIVEPSVVFEMLDSVRKRPGTIAALEYLETRLRRELHPTRSSLEREAKQRRRANLPNNHASWDFVHYVIRNRLAGSIIDDMLDILQSLVVRQSGEDASRAVASEIHTLRSFTRAYQKAADTNASTTIHVRHDVRRWTNEGFEIDLAELELDEVLPVRLRRAASRLPNTDLVEFDASTGSTEEFNTWFYFARNLRDYVVVDGPVNDRSNPPGGRSLPPARSDSRPSGDPGNLKRNH